MASPKAERYADELGLVKPTTRQFEELIDDCIFSERDRYILKRYILDDVPAGEIAVEASQRFPYAPLDEIAARRAIRRGINTISKYV